MCEYKVPSLINMYFITGHCYYLVSKSHHHRKMFFDFWFPASFKSMSIRKPQWLYKNKDKYKTTRISVKINFHEFYRENIECVIREEAKVAVCNFISLKLFTLTTLL